MGFWGGGPTSQRSTQLRAADGAALLRMGPPAMLAMGQQRWGASQPLPGLQTGQVGSLHHGTPWGCPSPPIPLPTHPSVPVRPQRPSSPPLPQMRAAVGPVAQTQGDCGARTPLPPPPTPATFAPSSPRRGTGVEIDLPKFSWGGTRASGARKRRELRLGGGGPSSLPPSTPIWRESLQEGATFPPSPPPQGTFLCFCCSQPPPSWCSWERRAKVAGVSGVDGRQVG